ncbi:lipid droplet-associated protein [[Mycobacterium] wendilense]|uniref:Lipid droplet-associated protein n=1 Tax=[Mycobacterium] wendilense TaxID=3064284 RepID=A0ABN9NVE2_9MYCO|nr:lipid droplet-associated protein [Mycolicibacterium sp. MU0050]CAJ1580478.1 lipid droplet-associated protein [Mycolicibacterium sp. MU0050]
MSSAPYGVRLLVGVAATAVEETRKLPQTILMSPMSLASQFAHLVMKVQQDLADLVIKGDSTLETLFPPKDEQPEWATFDEDEDDSADAGPSRSTDSGERMTEGRFALYSTDETPAAADPPSSNGQSAAEVSAPDVASRIDYASLTLAQLRARLQSLSVDELSELLAFEEATKARAPFQTLLANRITRASAK